MNCLSCDTETIHKIVDYICNNRTLGDVVVPQVGVEQCPKCGQLILSGEAERAVSDYLKNRQREAIASLPADDLISAGQAAEILGVTKQAFSKNPKIKKGYVYFTYIGTKKFFFRSSLELYKTGGDGRFPIAKWQSSVHAARIESCATADSKWQPTSSTNGAATHGAYMWNTSVQARR